MKKNDQQSRIMPLWPLWLAAVGFSWYAISQGLVPDMSVGYGLTAVQLFAWGPLLAFPIAFMGESIASKH